MEQALRRAILDSGLSAYRIAKDSGVLIQSVLRFLRGGSLSTATADKLATYLGLELRPKDPARLPGSSSTWPCCSPC
jgi:transcriptional regulator with XRE-family HTH domain